MSFRSVLGAVSNVAIFVLIIFAVVRIAKAPKTVELTLPERCSSLGGEWVYKSQAPTCMRADGSRLAYSVELDDFTDAPFENPFAPVMLSAATEIDFDSCLSKINEADYIVEDISNARPRVDFLTYPEASLYRTAITKDVARGINFAGKYVVSTWGCGAGCVGSAVINVENGRILAYGWQAASYDFELESRLLRVGDERALVVIDDRMIELCSQE